jgi:hypothetical protein
VAGEATPRAREHIQGELTPPSCRICALVQKVKIRRLGRSPEVTDLAGIRNLRNMVNAEFWLVPRLKAFDHQTWIAARRATSLRVAQRFHFARVPLLLLSYNQRSGSPLIREQKLAREASMNQSDSQVLTRWVNVSYWIRSWKGVSQAGSVEVPTC